MDVIHHDDVVYPMKVDADESASVEAQAYAIAVAKRPAPRAVVGVRQATHQCRFDTPLWQMASAAAPSGTAAMSRVQRARWASATAANSGNCARSSAYLR